MTRNWWQTRATAIGSSAPRTRRPLAVEPLEDRNLLSTLLALTTGNSLLRFDSATPAAITATTAVSGLQTGENLLGIDFRPATGQLYGLAVTGTSARIGVLDATAGAFTQVGAAFTVSGTDFGFDFNPTVDRIRIVSDADINLNVNPADAVVLTQTNLNPGNPNVVGSAYSNNFISATATTLFGIDSGSDMLVIQAPPASGTLANVGPLGVDASGLVGFDILTTGTGTNTAFAALNVVTVAQLHSINLVTGVATLVGPIGLGTTPVRGLAVVPAGTLQFSAPAYTVAENGLQATITVTRTGGSEGSVSATVMTSNGTATAGSDYNANTATVTFAAGDATPKTFNVTILDDRIVEGNETVNLTLSNATGDAVLGAASTAVLNILDDEAPALTAFALTTANTLVRFDSGTPGTITPTTALVGLGTGENLVGIDFRPATGQLYGLAVNGTTARLVTIDIATGLIGQVGSTFTVSGTDFGFDFNPTNDRVRVVSDADINLALNPGDGTVTTQTNLNPGNPNVVGSAYSNSFAGANATTLYGIDSNSDMLVTQVPAAGTLTNVGSLGVDTSGLVGFDIAASGNTGLAVLTAPGATASRLFTINLATGAATLIGPVGGTQTVRGLAVVQGGTLQFSAPTFTVSEADGFARITVTRTGGSEGTATVNFAVTAGTATAGLDFLIPTPGTLTFAPGETSKTFNIPIIDDGRAEANETVNLTLSGPVGTAGLGTQTTAVLTIIDDEQGLTANQRFVSQVYFDVLGRRVDAGGLAFWTASLSNGASRSQVVLGITSSLEYRTLVVQGLYQTYLKRVADPGGLIGFVNALGAGATVEQIASILVSSPEYFQRNGGTNNSFLAALFQDALGRPIDPTGQMVFGQALMNNATRGQVADAIFTSREYRQRLVQSFYTRFLNRSADPTGLDGFVNALGQGARDEQVIAAIVGSAEYFQNV